MREKDLVLEVTGLMFKGYPCTKDCSGHKAGWRYAMNKGMDMNNPQDVQTVTSWIRNSTQQFLGRRQVVPRGKIK